MEIKAVLVLVSQFVWGVKILSFDYNAGAWRLIDFLQNPQQLTYQFSVNDLHY